MAVGYHTSAELLPNRRWTSWTTALMLHALLLLAISLLFASRDRGRGEFDAERVVSLVVTSGAHSSQALFEQLDEAAAASSASESVFDPADATDVQQQAVEVSPLVEPFPPSAPHVDLPGIQSPQQPFAAGQVVDPDSLPTAASQLAAAEGPRVQQSRTIVLTTEELEELRREAAALAAEAPAGPPASTQVFGSGQITGQRIVFVLDRSGSMGVGGLGVLPKAVNELRQAVAPLADYHRFQIVAYHHATVMMNERRLLRATDDKKSAVQDFVSNLGPLGGTRHDLALFAALALRPDAIVIMTDGDTPMLTDGQLTQIRQSARGAQIHAVQFGRGPSLDANHFLKRLAEQNNGSYRYIDVNRW